MKEEPLIEGGVSASCWGCGCCYSFDFKKWVLPCIACFISNFPVWPWGKGIINEDEKSQILICGVGMPVFGTSYKDAFLDPKNIKPKNIAFFIKQLAESCCKSKELSEEILNQLIKLGDEKQFVVYSASAGSFLALSYFLKNCDQEKKGQFFVEVFKELFPKGAENTDLQKKVRQFIEEIAKRAVLVNPPAILYHAGFSYLGPKEQASAVGVLASEKYFTNMIESCLSGDAQVNVLEIGGHITAIKKNVIDEKNNPGKRTIDLCTRQINFLKDELSELENKERKVKDPTEEEIKGIINNQIRKLAGHIERSQDKENRAALQLKFTKLSTQEGWDEIYANLKDNRDRQLEDIADRKKEINESIALQNNQIFLARDLKKFDGTIIFSSICDEAVFPLYYVVRFAEKLKELNCRLDDKKISDFVYKVMQYGEIAKKDDEFKFDEFCNLAIKDLGLFTVVQINMVSYMTQKYLEIRNDYLALQKEYWQKIIYKDSEQAKQNNNEAWRCFVAQAGKILEKQLPKAVVEPRKYKSLVSPKQQDSS